MKIDVECVWSIEDMSKYHRLKDREFSLVVDTDYVEDEGDLISYIADEIYREYDVIIPTSTDVKRIVKDFYGVVGKIFS